MARDSDEQMAAEGEARAVEALRQRLGMRSGFRLLDTGDHVQTPEEATALVGFQQTAEMRCLFLLLNHTLALIEFVEKTFRTWWISEGVLVGVCLFMAMEGHPSEAWIGFQILSPLIALVAIVAALAKWLLYRDALKTLAPSLPAWARNGTPPPPFPGDSRSPRNSVVP